MYGADHVAHVDVPTKNIAVKNIFYVEKYCSSGNWKSAHAFLKKNLLMHFKKKICSWNRKNAHRANGDYWPYWPY